VVTDTACQQSGKRAAPRRAPVLRVVFESVERLAVRDEVTELFERGVDEVLRRGGAGLTVREPSRASRIVNLHRLFSTNEEETMDLNEPITSVIPTLEGRVLQVLARTELRLSGSRIASLIPRASNAGVRVALSRLVDRGLLNGRSAPPAVLVRRAGPAARRPRGTTPPLRASTEAGGRVGEAPGHPNGTARPVR
jgi:hypothetical protein